MLLTVSQPYNSGDLNSGGSQDLENSFKNQDGFENFPLDNHSLFESPTETPNKSTCQIITLKILDSHTLAIFMSFVTIYALFSDDIRIAACTKEDDDVFYALSTIALFFFLLDLIASTIVKQDYRFSFYF